MNDEKKLMPVADIERGIYSVRGERVMLVDQVCRAIMGDGVTTRMHSQNRVIHHIFNCC